MFSTADRVFMAQALALARRGLYTTHPNPRVGCVLVKEGEVVGQGWHERAGGPHAEVMALRHAGAEAAGSVAYVTLEPCAHTGRTPPCAQALIDAGVVQVIAALEDPNPLVAGQGLSRLRSAGVQVQQGLLQAEAEALNPGFLRRMRGGLPWVRLKMACSLDGRTAMADGQSQWITGAAARRDVQRWRARSDVVLTGVGTVIMDNPALTVRPELWDAGEYPDRPPVRMLLDSGLRAPLASRMLTEYAGADVWWLWAGERVGARGGAQEIPSWVHQQQFPGQRPQPMDVLRWMAQQGWQEVLIEAGANVAGSFLQAGVVDELIVYQAMTLMGSAARPLVEWPLQTMAQQQRLQLVEERHIGNDRRLLLRRC